MKNNQLSKKPKMRKLATITGPQVKMEAGLRII
jgi:hypothetical protein